MSHLLVLFGPKRGIRLELGPSLVVGRGTDVGLQLVDPKVSREHCRFALTEEGASVEDLGGQNGTFVNGERLTATQALRAGDEIAVGDSLLVFDGAWDLSAARYDDLAVLVGDDVAAGGEPQGTGGASAKTAPAPLARESETGEKTLARSGAESGVETGSGSAVAALDALVDGLGRLARELSAANGEEAAARVVLQALVRELAPERAFVLVKSGTSVRPLVGQSTDACVPVSRSLLDQAEAAGRALVVRDALTDRALAGARSVARHKLRSVLVAPLHHRGQLAGFLHCDRAEPPYSGAEARILEAIACVASVHGLVRPRDAEPGASGSSASSSSPPAEALAQAPAGESPAFRAARARAATAAATPSTVLITGETGVGKEEIARFIHAVSPRASGPFVVVNAGAIPDALAESQLFGHERGAFTGAVTTQLGLVEQAEGGTLFLDEIGELGPALQVKLLRVLQEKAVQRLGAKVARRIDCRVLAATHRDLAAEVKAGRFRQDLFYRLNVIEVRLPPLRERLADLPHLTEVLLARLARALGRAPVRLSAEALSVLATHDWPGNIRELGNVLERALVLRPTSTRAPLDATELRAALGLPGLETDVVPASMALPPPAAPVAPPSTNGSGETLLAPSLALKIAALERTEIEAALRAARGVKTRAAQELGMSRPTLDKKIAELGIDLWRERGE